MSRTNILDNYYTKVLITGIIAFVGVCGGVYLGYAFVGEKQSESESREQRTVDVGESAMNLAIGDLFPLEDCTLPDGTISNFETLLAGKKTLLIFASVGCPPCTEFFEYFDAIESDINDDVQVVVSFSDHNPEITDQYQRLTSSYKKVFMNADYFADKYNIVVYPTIVGIDRSGFITHIQYVPTDWLDREIAEQYTRINLSSN
ncbi:MAG: redoxin family protein [bacterium]|nr:redoxin family protein [bacterium]